MSVIQAGNTTTTAFIATADTTSNLVFTTGGANTVALTLSNTQAATFANNVTVTGSVFSPNQISFTANTNSTGTYTTTAPAVITFTSVATNIGSCYNSSNGRFTVTVAGRYLLTAALMAATGTGRYYFCLRKNGSTLMAQAGGDSTNYLNTSISYVCSLSVGDYVEVYLISGTLYNQSVAENYFTGHLLG